LNCRDYMTESECHELDSPFPDGEHGYWGPFSTCVENCGMTAQGVCCSEGGEWGNFGGTTRICLENVGATECDYFGGTFWTHYYYTKCDYFGGTFWTHYYYTKDDWGRAVPLDSPEVIECVHYDDIVSEDCNNAGGTGATLCIDPCCNPIACCKDGSCIGDTYGNYDDMHPETQLPPLTRVSCEHVYGGIAVSGVCGDVDCCNATIYVGACCVGENADPPCQVMTVHECKEADGVFMGPTSVCDTVDCCFIDVDALGACCKIGDNGLGECSDVVNEDACVAISGEWQGHGTECALTNCTGYGACCKDEGGAIDCYDDVYASDCACNECTYWGDGSTCCSPA